MRARKSLGQHFLTSKGVVDTIVTKAKLTESDTVLEIGPGTGTLTRALLVKAGCVIAVEKDEKLIHKLEKQFKYDIAQKKLQLVSADILTLPFEKHIPKDFIVVANIPYYITGQLLRKLLSGKQQPKRAVLMIQKEVAQRIVAQDGKESLLSISVKAYGTPCYVAKVPKRYFKPQPKVDSAILAIENISRSYFKNRDEELFFKLIKIGFAHKRKQLLKNLSEHYSREVLEKLFDEMKLKHNIRAEALKLSQWKILQDKID